MPESVFIETTIPSYLTSRPANDIIRQSRQKLTREWWDSRRRDYRLFTSQIVLDEAAQGDPVAAQKRLRRMDEIPILATDHLVISLAEKLLSESIVPKKAPDDAAHISCAAVHGIDYILTWNFRHIANPHIQRSIRQCIEAEGYEMPTICTPEDFYIL